MYQLDVFNEFGFRNAPHYVFSGDRLEKLVVISIVFVQLLLGGL